MLLLKIFNIIKFHISEYFLKKDILSLACKLRNVEFCDISDNFPSEYFKLDFEPLYAFYKIIQQQQICLINENYGKAERLVKILNGLFINNEQKEQKLPLKLFSGVVYSRNEGKCSFYDFKQNQYEEYLKNKSDSKYNTYDSVRYDVLENTDITNGSPIKNCIKLNWSNAIYTMNSDKSHRFALLCKLNEIENKNDAELFNVSELLINEKNKEEFLDNYDGFIINSKTATEIVRIFSNNSLRIWENYCPYPISKSADCICIIFYKKTKSEILNIFLKSENVIYINSLLEKSQAFHSS